MRENGFTDEVTKKQEADKKLQWNNATIRDLHLPLAVTIEDGVISIVGVTGVVQRSR